ncbi:hypothetical protein [Streptacidiphilus sp. PAMC 29251]
MENWRWAGSTSGARWGGGGSTRRGAELAVAEFAGGDATGTPGVRSASTSSTWNGRFSAAARSSARSAACALPAAATSTSGSAASAVASASAKIRWPSATRTRIRATVVPSPGPCGPPPTFRGSG